MEPQSTRFEISWVTLWRIAFFVGLVYLLVAAREIVGVFVIAMVVALGLDPFVSAMERYKLPRLLGTSIVFFAGVLALGAVVYLVLPIIIGELVNFAVHFSDSLHAVFDVGLPENLLENVRGDLERALAFLSSSDFSVTGAISSALERFLLIIVTIVISFYFTVEERGIERFFKVVLPDAYERSVLSIFARFKEKIRNWFSAQLGLSLAVGAIVALGLWLLGVRYYLALGLLAAAFEIVPIIGPVVSGAVAILVAAGDSYTLALYTFIFFILVQQLENHILTPVVMGRAVKVHPIMVVMALFVGGVVAGFPGILLSVPLAVLAQEIFNYLAEQKRDRKGMV